MTHFTDVIRVLDRARALTIIASSDARRGLNSWRTWSNNRLILEISMTFYIIILRLRLLFMNLLICILVMRLVSYASYAFSLNQYTVAAAIDTVWPHNVLWAIPRTCHVLSVINFLRDTQKIFIYWMCLEPLAVELLQRAVSCNVSLVRNKKRTLHLVVIGNWRFIAPMQRKVTLSRDISR